MARSAPLLLLCLLVSTTLCCAANLRANDDLVWDNKCVGHPPVVVPVSSVVMQPYPAVLGSDANVVLTADLGSRVLTAGTVTTVFYILGIPVKTLTDPLCSVVACPATGTVTGKKVFDKSTFPAGTRAGTYKATFTVSDESKTELTCIDVQVKLVAAPAPAIATATLLPALRSSQLAGRNDAVVWDNKCGHQPVIAPVSSVDVQPYPAVLTCIYQPSGCMFYLDATVLFDVDFGSRVVSAGTVTTVLHVVGSEAKTYREPLCNVVQCPATGRTAGKKSFDGQYYRDGTLKGNYTLQMTFADATGTELSCIDAQFPTVYKSDA